MIQTVKYYGVTAYNTVASTRVAQLASYYARFAASKIAQFSYNFALPASIVLVSVGFVANRLKNSVAEMKGLWANFNNNKTVANFGKALFGLGRNIFTLGLGTGVSTMAATGITPSVQWTAGSLVITPAILKAVTFTPGYAPTLAVRAYTLGTNIALPTTAIGAGLMATGALLEGGSYAADIMNRGAKIAYTYSKQGANAAYAYSKQGATAAYARSSEGATAVRGYLPSQERVRAMFKSANASKVEKLTGRVNELEVELNELRAHASRPAAAVA